MLTDPIADLLTRIRNAQASRHRSVRVIDTKGSRAILEVLKKDGFIESFSSVKTEGPQKECDVVLRYYESGEPLITRIQRVSRPGQRQYSQVSDLPKVFSGLGISIVSTSQGVMSDRDARKLGIGGEVVAVVG